MSTQLKRIVLFVVTISSLHGTSRATAISVYNRLGDGYDLNIHCQSGDDDLGNHVLTNSADFSFHFQPNSRGTTLFFCGLQWQGGSLSFDVYDYIRDFRRCENWCFWNVATDGVFGYDDNRKLYIKYPWD